MPRPTATLLLGVDDHAQQLLEPGLERVALLLEQSEALLRWGATLRLRGNLSCLSSDSGL